METSGSSSMTCGDSAADQPMVWPAWWATPWIDPRKKIEEEEEEEDETCDGMSVLW